jgi:outer membrane beta-barrel protein
MGKRKHGTTETDMSSQIYSRMIFSICIASTLVAFGFNANAQGPAKLPPAQQKAAVPTSAAPAQGQGDKLDVSDLEQKYWAAKDTDFSVVQNRMYSKAGRVALSGVYGSLLNDPWTTGATYGGSLSYYFSERYGMELSYLYTDARDSKAVDYLRSNQGGTPDYNKLKGYYGLGFEWIPFYAKMSVLNSLITYFDMGFTFGAGMQTYEQQKVEGATQLSTPAVELTVTQHYFLSKHLGVRVDLKNRWYQEQSVAYRIIPNRDRGTSTTNQTFLLLGMTLFF